jgi:hypothetical protein
MVRGRAPEKIADFTGTQESGNADHWDVAESGKQQLKNREVY